MTVKLGCLQVKNKLQEYYDQTVNNDQVTLDEKLQIHLDSCSECRHFYQNLQQLSSRLFSAFDQELKNIQQPDFSEIFIQAKHINQKKIKKKNFYTYGLAAIFVVILTLGLLLYSFINSENKNLVVDANHYLVEQVFEDSFFEGIEYVSLDTVKENNIPYDLFDSNASEFENEESIISLFPDVTNMGKEL